VIDQRRKRGIAPEPGAGRTLLGPVGSGGGAVVSTVTAPTAKVELPAETATAIVVPDFTPATVITDHFTVPYPPSVVFDLFGDVASVARCLPGVTLIGVPRSDYAEGMIQVRIGPIAANFRGAARIERSPESWSGRIVGIGNDQRSRSTSQGEIRYRLEAIEAGATRVEISIGYSLKGMLAQMAREGLVRELVARLTADFSRNLDRHLSGAEPEASAKTGQGLNGLSLLTHALRQYVRKFFRG
jgi:carbon-monoxide dehydrogenase small subunit